jgi:hypothetical protein
VPVVHKSFANRRVRSSLAQIPHIRCQKPSIAAIQSAVTRKAITRNIDSYGIQALFFPSAPHSYLVPEYTSFAMMIRWRRAAALEAKPHSQFKTYYRGYHYLGSHVPAQWTARVNLQIKYITYEFVSSSSVRPQSAVNIACFHLRIE